VPYANLSNPQTLNLYAMVADNPETFADLDGHDCQDDGHGGTCQSHGEQDKTPTPKEWADQQRGSKPKEKEPIPEHQGHDSSGNPKDQNTGPSQQQGSQQQQCEQWGCGGGTPKSGGLTPPPSGQPPIPLPPGKDGQPNEWEQVPGTQDKQFGPRWKPKYTPKIPEGGRQPSAWWDPFNGGQWSHEPLGGGPREHYDRWGNRINLVQVARVATVGGVAATMIRIVIILAEGAAF